MVERRDIPTGFLAHKGALAAGIEMVVKVTFGYRTKGVEIPGS
jgi:hypothetical protein